MSEAIRQGLSALRHVRQDVCICLQDVRERRGRVETGRNHGSFVDKRRLAGRAVSARAKMMGGKRYKHLLGDGRWGRAPGGHPWGRWR